MLISSFYKYVNVEKPQELQKEIFSLCQSLALKGRILLGNEGINGYVCGNEEPVKQFQKELKENNLFSDIEFKDMQTNGLAFKKLFVRVREEIVNFGEKVDLKNTADFVEPEKLKEMLDNGEEIILLDMRNDYEAMIGKFKNARTLSIRNFRDLPNVINEIGDLKSKRVLTYCTGGIRCEKASAYLKEKGFNNVIQLKGGIINFAREFPDTYWEGKLFVFDDRIAVDVNSRDTLNKCAWCNSDECTLVNCHNIGCDRLFLICKDCLYLHKASCSADCENSANRRKKNVLFEKKAVCQLLN